MTDIKDARILYLKAFLFLVAGSLSACLLLVKHPQLETALLLAITTWSFSRAYYFAFYVIQHYVDDRFRFAGIFDFVLYVLGKKTQNT